MAVAFEFCFRFSVFCRQTYDVISTCTSNFAATS